MNISRATLLLTVAAIVVLRGQQTDPAPTAQAISETGLLPVYGVAFNFDPAWVNAAKFPSQSAEYPNDVDARFQQVWDTLAPAGYNVIRFPVDVRDAASAVRVANLCAWAAVSNVKIVPMLVGADRGTSLAADFASNTASVVRTLIATLRSADPPRTDTYAQILAFQLEHAMNHAGLHGQMAPETAQLRVLQAASALRQVEQEGLKDSGLDPTPMLVDASFDYELVRAGVLGPAPLDDAAYASAYDALKQFLSELAASTDVNILAVEWFPGSVGAGSVDRFPTLLQSLKADFPGKQILITTGFSTAFRSAEEQQQFYTLAFANLADYRATEGVDAPFLGVLFHDALRPTGAQPEPPTSQVVTDMAQWDWGVKARELADTWAGRGQSPVMAWWAGAVERNMGLLAMEATSGGVPSVTSQPAQEELEQIAETVSEANVAAMTENQASTYPPEEPAPSGGGQSLLAAGAKERAQQFLLGLLDRTLERVGNMIPGFGAGAGAPASEPGTPSAGSASIAVAGVAVQPEQPSSGQPTSVLVTVANQSSDVSATGLVVMLVDENGQLLGNETYISDVAVGVGGAADVPIPWTPLEARTYQLRVSVGDVNFYELASSSPIAVTVGGGDTVASPYSTPAAPPAPLPLGTTVRLPPGLPSIKGLELAQKVFIAGQAAPLSISLSNPYSRALLGVRATLMVDGKPLQTKTLGTLLPKQVRSATFAGVTFSRPGKHDVRFSLESSGPQRRTGFVSTVVQVQSRPPMAMPAQAARAIPQAARPVRSALPPTFVQGRTTVPTGASASSTKPTTTTSRSTPAVTTSRQVPAAAPNTTRPGSATETQPKAEARATTPPPRVLPPVRPAPSTPAADRPSRAPATPEGRTAPRLPVLALKPDLALSPSDISFASPAPRAGQPLRVRVRVRNIGKAAARGATVTCVLRVDGRDAERRAFPIASIDAGGTATVEWTVRVPAGRQFHVDASAAVSGDQNAGNNHGTLPLRLAVPLQVPRQMPRR